MFRSSKLPFLLPVLVLLIGMVHTSFHFKILHPHLEGAVDRLAQFFTEPLLARESVLAEVENVHAEYSRNRNSDARKLLQVLGKGG
jgi:secreted Zn-dependent insulinase-like peptidase